MTADKLPPCPLCGDVPDVVRRAHLVYAHRRTGCALHGGCFTPDEWRKLAAPAEEVERLKDALDRQAAHYGGALSIEKARADALQAEVERLTDRNRVCGGLMEALHAEIDREKARADRLLAALREVKDNGTHICRIGAEKCPVCIAAAALAADGEG